MMNKKVKRTISLLVVLSLTVSMLTGCAFLVPLMQRGIKELVSDGGHENNQIEDKNEKNLTEHSDSIDELLGKIYETEYQPSSFIQEDVESETVQWICATYALYNQVNGKDLDRIGGFWDHTLMSQDRQDEWQEKMKIHIWGAWGVDNRKTFVETLQNLLNKERPADEAKELLGWDLSRANQMIGDACYVKFINLEECLDLSLLISQEIQNNYNSWEELSESHLEGLRRLKKDNPKDPDSESGKRLAAYEELKEEAQKGEGPYAIPFDMRLVKSWDESTVADKSAEREVEEKEREQADEEFEESKIKQDADGRIDVCGYSEDDPTLKVKVPKGLKVEEYSTENFAVLSDAMDEISITYTIKRLYGGGEPKEDMEEEKQFQLELYPDKTSIIAENYEGDEDEAKYYFGVEIKNLYDDGDSIITYYGYSARKINGEWVGLHSNVAVYTEVDISKEDALAWLLPDVQWP